MLSKRLGDLDRYYVRTMTLCAPLAVAILVTLLFTVPAERITALRETQIARPGPLKVLPELDIIPQQEEETRLSAAPRRSLPADFVVIDIDLVFDPDAEVVEPLPEPEKEQESDIDPFQFLTLDDLMSEVRTTGAPVFAQAQIHVIDQVRPVYPRTAVELGIEGTVEVMLRVGTRGKVEQAYVVYPNQYPTLEAAAVDAFYQTLFKPFLVDGRPIVFWVRIAAEFALVE